MIEMRITLHQEGDKVAMAVTKENKKSTRQERAVMFFLDNVIQTMANVMLGGQSVVGHQEGDMVELLVKKMRGETNGKTPLPPLSGG